MIAANIQALGFKTTDIKLILNSHTHFDHAGGISAIQRASGAEVAASAASALALRDGHPTQDDPQFAIQNNGFPPVANVRVVEDGETISVGDVQLTAHLTPGHTPGGTSWTWKSCEGERCLSIVYADSLNAVSAEGFRFTGTGTTPSIVDMFRRSIRNVAELPCDILLSPHPEFVRMEEKLQRRHQGETGAFVDASACRAYAGRAAMRLDERIAEESSAAR